MLRLLCVIVILVPIALYKYGEVVREKLLLISRAIDSHHASESGKQVNCLSRFRWPPCIIFFLDRPLSVTFFLI